MAIYSDSDYGSIIQIKNDFCANSHTVNSINAYCVHNIGTGGFLLKVTGGEGGGEPDAKVLLRAVQQLNMLHRADTKSHFWHPEAHMIPHFYSPRVENEKIVTYNE